MFGISGQSTVIQTRSDSDVTHLAACPEFGHEPTGVPGIRTRGPPRRTTIGRPSSTAYLLAFSGAGLAASSRSILQSHPSATKYGAGYCFYFYFSRTGSQTSRPQSSLWTTTCLPFSPAINDWHSCCCSGAEKWGEARCWATCSLHHHNARKLSFLAIHLVDSL